MIIKTHLADNENILKNEEGSFTLEASLVFPIIFLTLLTLLFLIMLIFNQVFIHYKAHMVSEQLAFTWNNTQRNPMTGELWDYQTMQSASIKYDNGKWRTDGFFNVTQIVLPGKAVTFNYSGETATNNLLNDVEYGASHITTSQNLGEVDITNNDYNLRFQNALKLSGGFSSTQLEVKRDLFFLKLRLENSKESKLPSVIPPVYKLEGKREANSEVYVVNPADFLRNYNFVKYLINN